jgi:hypothetical protein
MIGLRQNRGNLLVRDNELKSGGKRRNYDALKEELQKMYLISPS